MKLTLYETMRELVNEHGQVSLNDVRSLSVWGFIDDDGKTAHVHMYVEPETPKCDVVEFLGHELGHREEPKYNHTEWEERKADRYGRVAVKAYDLANRIYR